MQIPSTYKPAAALVVATLTLIFAATSFAQPAATPAQPEIPTTDVAAPKVVDTVIVKNPKNAAVMPYDAVYERLKRMQDSKLDRVRLQIKINVKDETVKLADVRAAIVSDTVSIPMPIAKENMQTPTPAASGYINGSLSPSQIMKGSGKIVPGTA